MNKILFDASSHLGQFDTTNLQVQAGCKNLHTQMEKGKAIGFWTDLDNGRVDRSIWSLPRDVQDDYYPYMDRFFSLSGIKQKPFFEEDEELAIELKSSFSKLSLYSRYEIAQAVSHQVDEIRTLFSELLEPDVVEHVRDTFGIEISQPFAEEAEDFDDKEMEQCFQTALETFHAQRVQMLEVLRGNDRREVMGSSA